ncbi:MAG: hypothetical protein JW839_02165 [Candidatus Lokiarchaeota archaeon]|nr:hypothetical protein [Candidatus Lokiarchaeota archaeon]
MDTSSIKKDIGALIEARKARIKANLVSGVEGNSISDLEKALNDYKRLVELEGGFSRMVDALFISTKEPEGPKLVEAPPKKKKLVEVDE